MKADRIAGSIVVSLSLACAVRATPDIDAHVANLTSEDPKVAKETRRYLEAMGGEAVPKLFDKLLVADWTLRPRLLEVLSANGRDFTKNKLLSGNETEKMYAALAYELTRAGQPDDYDTAEFKGMVEALLRAIKSDDKYLRAAAGLALTYDVKSTVFFEHLHAITPALISSFDIDLVLERQVHCGDPSSVVLVGIGLRLDALIGERLAYQDMERALWKGVQLNSEDDIGSVQRSMREFLNKNKVMLGELREYWERWWGDHEHLSPVDIGRLAIERDISFLEAANNSEGYQDSVVVSSFLELWTGRFFTKGREARTWWTTHKDAYKGPKG